MKDNVRKEILNSIKSLSRKYSSHHIREFMDEQRLKDFQVNSNTLSLDYSKQRINEEILQELLLIPDKIDLKKSISQISEGTYINSTENRKVSHMVYRNFNKISGSMANEIGLQEKKLEKFFLNFENDFKTNITSVICIGIGGSRLGPELLSEVYEDQSSQRQVYYCSSFDLIELENLISSLNSKNTLIVISSKSFKTPEVLANANRAIEWIEESDPKNFMKRIIGISSSNEEMTSFGIIKDNQYNILDSLGGRFSIWSSISLPAIIDIGWNSFVEFKRGAQEADEHFINSSWRNNIPVLMALLNCWNMNGLGINNLGIFTYAYRIRSLINYLSQMGMESNGKISSFQDSQHSFKTCPLIWGGYGPTEQHSVFQWILQGSYYAACDFIGVHNNNNTASDSYRMLLSQITALSQGENNNKSRFKSVEGNNPISLLKLNNLSPRSLGFLIATYEHKIFVESQIYGINSFDQWGVQLGKKLTKMSQDGKGMESKFFDTNFYS